MFTEDAEFQDMMDVAPLYVSSVKGGTHIAVDEKGVTASAYTAIMYCGAMLTTEKLDMKLDRPFLWTITVDGTVLFVGIVSNPARVKLFYEFLTYRLDSPLFVMYNKCITTR